MSNEFVSSLYGDNPPNSQKDIEKSIRKKFKHDLEGRFEKVVVQYGVYVRMALILTLLDIHVD